MKKVLSLILTLCMFGAFAISASAASTDTTSHKLNIVETETGATVEYILAGEFENFSAIKAIVTFDNTKVTYADIAYEGIDGWKGNMTSKGSNYLIFTNGEAKGDSSKYITGKDQKVATITFNKVDNASLTKDDIKIATTQKVGRTTHKITTAISGAAYDTGIVISEPTFTAYTPDEPDKPSFVIPEDSEKTGENNGIVDINTNTETGAYSVKVTAPIGKKAVIYIDGVAQTGSEISGTATKETTIKVAYEDVTDEVITYVVPMSSIYGAEDGIAAFGKGTIAEGDDFGIIFGGVKEDKVTLSAKDRTKPDAVKDIFGVEVKDAPAGKYTAQAYIGANVGEEISFTK